MNKYSLHVRRKMYIKTTLRHFTQQTIRNGEKVDLGCTAGNNIKLWEFPIRKFLRRGILHCHYCGLLLLFSLLLLLL